MKTQTLLGLKASSQNFCTYDDNNELRMYADAKTFGYYVIHV